jgi:hypothetical protein
METNSTKLWQIILGVIVIVILGVIIAFKPAKVEPEPVVTGPDIEDPNIDATQLCYIWNTEAGDKAQLSMDIRADQVIGEFNWLPFEKDRKTGIFKGTVGPLNQMEMARTVNGWWETSAEGMKNTEQIIIKFGDGTAGVGFGEMKEDAQGRWVYADPTKLSFAPTLSQTDCGDEAMD